MPACPLKQTACAWICSTPTLCPLLIAASASQCLLMGTVTMRPLVSNLRRHCASPLTHTFIAVLPSCCSVLQRLLRRNPLAAMSLHKPISRPPSQALLGTIPYGMQPVGELLGAPWKQGLHPASCVADLLWHACRSCQFLVHAVVSTRDASLQVNRRRSLRGSAVRHSRLLHAGTRSGHTATCRQQ